MKPFPEKLQRVDEETLQIDWNDGVRMHYPVRELRDKCPCATCREKRKEGPAGNDHLLPVLTPAETQPLRLIGLRPIGNYAYGLQFSDGHDTGIFSLEFLREIGNIIQK